jgi:hypothetical protein
MSDFERKIELYHGNLKTIQAVKEDADDAAALVHPKMIHYTTVNIQKAADLCVKQSILNNFNICIDCKSWKD